MGPRREAQRPGWARVAPNFRCSWAACHSRSRRRLLPGWLPRPCSGALTSVREFLRLRDSVRRREERRGIAPLCRLTQPSRSSAVPQFRSREGDGRERWEERQRQRKSPKLRSAAVTVGEVSDSSPTHHHSRRTAKILELPHSHSPAVPHRAGKPTLSSTAPRVETGPLNTDDKLSVPGANHEDRTCSRRHRRDLHTEDTSKRQQQNTAYTRGGAGSRRSLHPARSGGGRHLPAAPRVLPIEGLRGAGRRAQPHSTVPRSRAELGEQRVVW